MNVKQVNQFLPPTRMTTPSAPPGMSRSRSKSSREPADRQPPSPAPHRQRHQHRHRESSCKRTSSGSARHLLAGFAVPPRAAAAARAQTETRVHADSATLNNENTRPCNLEFIVNFILC
ncbi:hypothetical protein BCR33DRAFT_582831 [Rhizoclosmatium globosum]|uniref:Uncharacterized protein n=1 Tax=Rhizoclosmatium globosum TaxID=329046 RepID=A0A1Y2CR61_9FUNG|nr:hypothetical protein BCR33DRAFT_582831 [Rhizoclosmatium globosum]|eukprot:ORY49436.1 hypothetical protein BCR33DRAFT_582831 [Rhizoclosmatium globosum]